MDISTINNVAKRKKLTVELEKLRDKVSKENKQVINRSVAQDNDYWDLKQQLGQNESNLKKLHKNMLEVQMQYETVYGNYQDEQRHRAEMLEKLASVRELCKMLEENCERLRDTVSRCKADQTALYNAYQQSGQHLREFKAAGQDVDEKNLQTIKCLQEQLKFTTEHLEQLKETFTKDKQRLDLELQDAKNKLVTVLGENNQNVAANAELGALVEHIRRELEKKEEAITRIQADIKKYIEEFRSQANEMQNIISKQEKEIKENISAHESLKQAMSNQENYAKSISDQNNQLQDKLAALEGNQAQCGKNIEQLETNLQRIGVIKENLQTEIEELTERSTRLEKENSERDELIANCKLQLQKLTDELTELKHHNSELSKDLQKYKIDAQAKVKKVKELTEAIRTMELKLKELEHSLTAARDTVQQKKQDETSIIKEKDKALESETSKISQLMNEVQNASKSQADEELTIQKVRQEFIAEKDSDDETDKTLLMKIEQIQISIRNKDNERSKNKSVLLELGSDKERLNEKKQRMQNKIDNIHNELTHPAASNRRFEPEQDDNAVMFTPASQDLQLPSQKISEFAAAAPLQERNNDPIATFNFLSDASMDGENSFDAPLATLRSKPRSREEPRSSSQFSSLKRRRAPTPVPTSQYEARADLLFKRPARYEDTKPPSQPETNNPSKPRIFFKNKRQDRSKKHLK